MIKPPFYPKLPPSGASRAQRLSFVQRNYLYSMAWIVPMFAIGLLVSSVVIVLICVAGWLVGIAGLMSLSARIRKERGGDRR
jgi:ABC-type amino acid transport system permease subunit